jgi:hypothetical protein
LFFIKGFVQKIFFSFRNKISKKVKKRWVRNVLENKFVIGKYIVILCTK